MFKESDFTQKRLKKELKKFKEGAEKKAREKKEKIKEEERKKQWKRMIRGATLQELREEKRAGQSLKESDIV